MRKDKIAIIDNGINRSLIDNGDKISEIDFTSKNPIKYFREIEPF